MNRAGAASAAPGFPGVPAASVASTAGDGLRTPAQPPYLFDTGAPSTDPFDLCGYCYAWSSTYYHAADNYDITGRYFTVPPGSFAYAIRMWWVYGADGPYDPYRNHGGTAGDFSDISIDLYAVAPEGGPGELLDHLTGEWITLNPVTNYREFRLDAPYTFDRSEYFLSLRAETGASDYDATILWLACAPHDEEVDWENADNGIWTTGGWDPYTQDNRPYNPCPQDMDFGLQVLGFLIPDGVDAIPLDPCIGATSCAPVAFVFHRMDQTPVRGFSVTFQLSPNLRMCPEADSVVEGSYLQAVGETSFQVLANGGNSYTVDCAILGMPCGAVGVGDLFHVRVARDPDSPDGPASATVGPVIVRDCLNQPVTGVPGSPASLVIASQPPGPVTDLAAERMLTDNNPPYPEPPLQVVRIRLDFSLPPEAVEAEIYRAPFGNYPEYDDPPNAGSEPGAPSYPPEFPWSLVTTTAGGPVMDRPPWRDFWYYVVFTRDACGNVSAVSNRTGGTLNYHLGDVSKGTPPLCTGNNRVFLEDLSLLGDHYGVTDTTNPLYLSCLDVGPTTDLTVEGRPLTDNRIEFEDLMIFSINFNQVRMTGEPAAVAVGGEGRGPARLQLQADAPPEQGVLTCRLQLFNPAGEVKGFHAFLEVDPARLELVSAEPGKLLEPSGGQVFFKAYPAPGGLAVDAALLGGEAAFTGSGEVAVLRWRMVNPSPGRGAIPLLLAADLRDPRNRPLGDGPKTGARLAGAAEGSPGRVPEGEVGLCVFPVRPNPFSEAIEIRYRLSSETAVVLEIFDISGRIVRTLRSGADPAGDHRVLWDGLDDRGSPAGSGLYLCRLRTAGEVRSQKLYRLR